MRSVIPFLLIFVAILATNAVPTKKKGIFRFALRREHDNTTLLHRRETFTDTRQLKHYGSRFITSFEVGSPPQTFDLVVDTAFPDIMIADAWCSNCGSLPKYDGGASSSFKDLGDSYSEFNSQFTGIWTEDIFNAPQFSFKRPFARGRKVPDDWPVTGKYSGYLGLGLHRTGPKDTLLDYFSSQQLLEEDIVSCRLVKNNDENAGAIVFGAREPQYIDGPIAKINIINSGTDPAWIIPILDTQSGQKSLGGANAVVTTGLTHMYLSDTVATDLYDGTGAQRMSDGTWAVPDPFPNDVTFIIGDNAYTVPKEDIPLKQFPKFGDLYRGAIQVTQWDVWTLGVPFIQNHYVVYDFTKGSENIGIAKRK